jgi:hypothetical protein
LVVPGLADGIEQLPALNRVVWEKGLSFRIGDRDDYCLNPCRRGSIPQLFANPNGSTMVSGGLLTHSYFSQKILSRTITVMSNPEGPKNAGLQYVVNGHLFKSELGTEVQKQEQVSDNFPRDSKWF